MRLGGASVVRMTWWSSHRTDHASASRVGSRGRTAESAPFFRPIASCPSVRPQRERQHSGGPARREAMVERGADALEAHADLDRLLALAR